jgi:hypothetical protein
MLQALNQKNFRRLRRQDLPSARLRSLASLALSPTVALASSYPNHNSTSPKRLGHTARKLATAPCLAPKARHSHANQRLYRQYYSHAARLAVPHLIIAEPHHGLSFTPLETRPYTPLKPQQPPRQPSQTQRSTGGLPLAPDRGIYITKFLCSHSFVSVSVGSLCCRDVCCCVLCDQPSLRGR